MKTLSHLDHTQIISNFKTRQNKLQINSKNIETQKNDYVFAEFTNDQYVAMIETLQFLNKKLKKEIANFKRITKISSQDVERLVNKAFLVESKPALCNPLLTEYRRSMMDSVNKYEETIFSIKSLVNERKEAIKPLVDVLDETKVINRDLQTKVKELQSQRLELGFLNKEKLPEAQICDLRKDLEKIINNEKEKQSLLSNLTDHLEIKINSFVNRNEFYQTELDKARFQLDKNAKEKEGTEKLYNKVLERHNILTENSTAIIKENKEIEDCIAEHIEKLNKLDTKMEKIANNKDTIKKSKIELKEKKEEFKKDFRYEQLKRYEEKIESFKNQMNSLKDDTKRVEIELKDLSEIKKNNSLNIEQLNKEIETYQQTKDDKELSYEKNMELLNTLKKNDNESFIIRRDIRENRETNREHNVSLVSEYNSKKTILRTEFHSQNLINNNALKDLELKKNAIGQLIYNQLNQLEMLKETSTRLNRDPRMNQAKLNQLIRLKDKVKEKKTGILVLKRKDNERITHLLTKGNKDISEQIDNKIRSIKQLKKSKLILESQKNVLFKPKAHDYEKKLAKLNALVEKRKEAIAKLEDFKDILQNNSIIKGTRSTKLEEIQEQRYKDKLNAQKQEIAELETFLNELTN